MTAQPVYRGSLRPETSATIIERALARFLALGLQVRLKSPQTGAATVANPPALRVFARKTIFDFAIRFVESNGKAYRFDAYETLADDGDRIIAPFDVGTGAGRWVQEGATIEQRKSPHAGIRDAAISLDNYALQRRGFARIVRIYEGTYDEEGIAEIFALKPAYVVVPYRITREPKSLVPGAYYLEKYEFRIWGISQNLRRGPAGILGNVLGDEPDPGLNYVMGAARKVLAGSTLGIAGVLSTEIGDEEIVAHDQTNRVFCNALSITVAATLHLPDEDLVPIEALNVTQQLADRGAEPQVDLRNYVADGCYPDRAGARLNTIRGGIAYIRGALVAAAPQTLTFPANSDTYRDLKPDGGFVVQSVAAGRDAPAQMPGTLRVGVTTTDADSIVSDRFLCSTLVNLIGPDHLPKQ